MAKITKKRATAIEGGLKKTGSYKGKSNKLGGGGRFAQLKNKIESSGKSPEAAAAIAAKVGMKKYGKKKMASMAAKGRKRASK
jgi:hypothetical protein